MAASKSVMGNSVEIETVAKKVARDHRKHGWPKHTGGSAYDLEIYSADIDDLERALGRGAEDFERDEYERAIKQELSRLAGR